MQSIRAWVRGQDQFGFIAQFNYRGETGYGTAIGGGCSLIISFLVGILVLIQISGSLFRPNYNQLTTVGYLDSIQPDA